MRSILVVVFLVHVGASRRLHHSHSHNFGTPQTPTYLSRVEQVTIDNNASTIGFKFNPSSKHAGRHVCPFHRNITYPIKTKQVYCKPTIKKYQERCFHNQLCTNVRVVYERAYRDVVTTEQKKHLTYDCCAGWTRVHKSSHGCNKPVCHPPCQNGGTCVKPNTCECPNGFTGSTCELDIDECKEKPCDQICHNIPGSFKCECRENFVLKEDGESCMQNNREETETSEIEGNDLDIALYENRISKLEKMFGSLSSEEVKKLQANYKKIEKHITYMEMKLNDMEQYKNDMQTFKNMLTQMEIKTSRVEEFMRKHENTSKLKYF